MVISPVTANLTEGVQLGHLQGPLVAACPGLYGSRRSDLDVSSFVVLSATKAQAEAGELNLVKI